MKYLMIFSMLFLSGCGQLSQGVRSSLGIRKFAVGDCLVLEVDAEEWDIGRYKVLALGKRAYLIQEGFGAYSFKSSLSYGVVYEYYYSKVPCPKYDKK